jgi:hypothetical protein
MMIETAVLAASLMVAAPAPDVPPGSDLVRKIKCKSCRFACATGTTNCWSCGSRVPGSEHPAKLVPRKLIVVDMLAKTKLGGASSAMSDPANDVKAVVKWIDANPSDHAGALKRLGDLLGRVRGTVHESRVKGRIAAVRAAVEEASRPMTKEERDKRAAAMVYELLPRITKRRDAPAENIRDLERLLVVVRGTDYEALVRSKIKAEKAKLKR